MAGEYRSLSINREEIRDCMEDYLNDVFNEVVVEDKEHKSNTLYRYPFTVDEEPMFLDFHFNGNGTTTIQPSSGGLNEVRKNLAEHIKNELSGVVSAKSSVSIKNIEFEDFEVFIYLLAENKGIENTDITSIDDGVRHSVYDITGVQGDFIKITYYENGTIFMQGKPLVLFSELTAVLSELYLNPTEMIKVLNKTYKSSVDKNSIENDYNTIMVDCKDSLPSKMQLVIKQALYNTKIEGDMFDYTFLVQPAFRALEGNIKYVAKENNVPWQPNIGDMFDYQNNHCLRIPEGTVIKQEVIDYLEKQYKLFRDVRNPYSHWGRNTGKIDNTVLIYKREDAVLKIFDILNEINYYYSICN
ncbi:type II toxin-antitoxin system RnlA family toxin [Enterococcus sp. DIV0213h]|uniref:type II toxin-antitoxin system RnlA family toxin n=1 Tax=Enterococcus sp. DIV0213h TaxID=2774669 RepID=UPI003F2308B2